MKSFINLEDGSNLTDLSPVLTCIRTLNESDVLWDEEHSKYFKSSSLKQLKCETDRKELEGFCFAVSLRDGSCLYTSGSITKYLGYPKSMLIGQCMMNFLFHKDHITFANHLTQGLNACFIQGKRDDSHLVLNTFFCRLRVYQGLKYGFSVTDQKVQYKPFKITFHINELILDDMCVEKPSGTLCVKATATHVECGYSAPQEIPAMSSFSTRHTASCHFSHVDGSAIPYLGYLPQDMIGYSVFDFYHIDDLLLIKDIYDLVIKEHGSSFRSKPYRFKVQNGDFILLETEWSCFINPWTHKLEFVVGQHRVLKGPIDIDIFTPAEIFETDTISEETLNESRKIQKEIKSVLSQTLPEVERMTRHTCNKRKRDLASFVYNCIDGTLKNKGQDNKNTDATNKEQPEENSDLDSVVMGDISPYRDVKDATISSKIPPTMQQLCYQENIERFFASKPKTYSDGSDVPSKNNKGSNSIDDSSISSSGSGNDSASVNATGSPPQDQENSSNKTFEHKIQESSSSSSRYNLSRDSGCGQSFEVHQNEEPSTSKVGPYNQTWNKPLKDCITHKAETFSSCLALTEESLSVHNYIGLKQLKQLQRKKAQSTVMKDYSLQQKELTNSKQKKKMTGMVSTNSPVTTSSASITSQLPWLQSHGSCPAASISSTPFFIPVMYMGSLPCYPSAPTAIPWSYSSPQNLEASPNIIFPEIPSFYHQNSFHMSSTRFPYPLYTTSSINAPNDIPTVVPFSGVTSTLPFTTTATAIASTISPNTKNSITGPTTATLDQGTLPRMPRGQEDQSNAHTLCEVQVEESVGSSFSSSLQSADKEQDMDVVLKSCCPSPSDKIELSSEIAYRYQMGVQNVSDILKKDLAVLQTMQQSEMVNQQLQILQDEIKDDELKCKEDISEEVMLGLTTHDQDLEDQERWLLQLMYEDA